MTLNAKLKMAVDALSIADVTLREVRAFLADGFDPELLTANPDILLQVVTPQCRSISKVDGVAEDLGRHRIVFEMFAGVRMLEISGESIGNVENERLADFVRATIECTFWVKYDVGADADVANLDDEALEQFSKHNVPFNMWPYWRELVHSACARMGLPRVVMPTHRLSKAATKRT